MKAKFVSESISFQRGIDPKEALGIGGYSYDTLRPGTILKSKKFFGVTKSGRLAGYHSASVSIRPENYLVVMEVLPGDKPKTKTIVWLRTHDLGRAQEMAKKATAGEPPGIEGWHFTGGRFTDLSKIRFNYRFDLIGDEANESISFERGGDPKETMRIGRAGEAIKIGAIFRVYKNAAKSRQRMPYFISRDLFKGFERNEFPERNVDEYIFERSSDAETLTFDDIIGNYIDYNDKLYDLTHTKKPVYEGINFERGQDPKRSMGIGRVTWDNLSPGDVLIPKKHLRISVGQFDKAYHFASPSQPGSMMGPTDPLVVIYAKHQVVATSRSRAPHWTEGLRIKFYQCYSQEEVDEVIDELNNGELETYTRKPIEGSLKQFENRFDIKQRYEN